MIPNQSRFNPQNNKSDRRLLEKIVTESFNRGVVGLNPKIEQCFHFVWRTGTRFWNIGDLKTFHLNDGYSQNDDDSFKPGAWVQELMIRYQIIRKHIGIDVTVKDMFQYLYELGNTIDELSEKEILAIVKKYDRPAYDRYMELSNASEKN